MAAFMVLLVQAGCAPSPQATSKGETGASAPARNGATPRKVVIGIAAEINTLAYKFEGNNAYAGDFTWMVNSPLAFRDRQGRANPLLATQLPSQDDGSWTVNPDGTMATVWKIRPNAVWQDGQPVVPRDFQFALKAYMDPAMTVSNRVPEEFIDHIDEVDDKTFSIAWNRTYPWANELINGQLEPLPEHIVGQFFTAGGAATFLSNSYWTTPAYVGEGPFRLAGWDPGSQLVYRAFDDYFMGRPKLDEVTFRIIGDTDTMVSNVLAGTVDTVTGITLGGAAGATIRDQWSKTGDGEIASYPVLFRYAQIQFDPNRNRQPALFDQRVRQAIVQGIDRESIAQLATEGLSPKADVMVSPNDPLFPQVDSAIAKHPYDPNRAAALLRDAGWPQQGQGLANSAGELFSLDIWTTAGNANEAEMSSIAANLTQLGMQINGSVIPQSRMRDNEYRVSFPGLNMTAFSIDIPSNMNIAYSDQCTSAEHHFAGQNRGCWSNPDYDRLYQTAITTLNPGERNDAVVNAWKVLTENVGIFGLSYTPESIPVKKGLSGPGPRWPAQLGGTWNVQDWQWTQ